MLGVLVSISEHLTVFDLDALRLQKISQTVDLVLELPDQLGVGVLVHHGLTDDLFRTIGVSAK